MLCFKEQTITLKIENSHKEQQLVKERLKRLTTRLGLGKDFKSVREKSLSYISKSKQLFWNTNS